MKKIISILLTLTIAITALGNETIEIIADEIKNNSESISKQITEENNESKLDIKEENIELEIEEYKALNYEIKSKEQMNLNWESDDKSIATVNNGLVQGKKGGKTKVKVYSNNILLDECEVIVREKEEIISSKSLMDIIELSPGITYHIKNTYNDTIYIYEGYGSRFDVDIISYSSSGELKSYGRGRATSLFLSKGESVKIKVTKVYGNDTTGIYTTSYKGKYLISSGIGGDFFEEVKVSKGSYKIKNNGDKAISIGNNSEKKIDGYHISSFTDSISEFICEQDNPGAIQPEDNVILSSSGGTVEFYYPKEYKITFEYYSGEPSVDKVIMQNDMVYNIPKDYNFNYDFFSSDDGDYPDQGNYKLEYIEYSYDDLIYTGYTGRTSYLSNKSDTEILSIDYKKIYGNRLIMMLPYGNKDSIKTREEKGQLLKQLDLFEDRHYIIKNNTSKNVKFGSSVPEDTILYDEDGNIVAYQGKNFVYHNADSILPNGKSKIGISRMTNGYILIPSEGFTIEEVGTPIWGEMEVVLNKKVKIKNTTGQVTAIHGSGSSNYAYKRYSSNGELIEQGNTWYGLNIYDILPNQTIEITLLEGDSETLFMEYSLLPEWALKKPIVESVLMVSGNEKIDISKIYVKINKNSKQSEKISVSVNWNGKTAKEVRLQQGGKYITSEDGNFDIVFGSEFNDYDNIYAVAVSQDDKVSKPVLLKTQLKNINNNTVGSSNTGSINIGKIDTPTIPENIPFLGLEKLDINYENVKFTTQFDKKKGTLKVIFGKNLNLDNENSIKFEEEFKNAKIAYELKKPSIKGSNTIKFGMWEVGAGIGLEGYAEYGYDNLKNDLIFMSGGITSAGNLNIDIIKQFIISYMPVYLKAALKDEASLGLSLDSNKSFGEGGYTLNGSFSISPELEPEGGIGIDGVTTLGVVGGLKGIINGESSKTNLSVKGYIGGKFTAGELFNVKFELGSFNWSSDVKSINSKNNVDIYDSKNYEQIPRDYLSENTGWNGNTVSFFNENSTIANEKNRILEYGIFSNAQPIISKVSGKQIMLWLRDNEKRNDINRTQLVYSIYDDDKNTWSEPNPVSESNTADYYPQVAYDENNLYVSWQKSKKIMNDNATLEDICKESEIAVSKFNIETNRFEKEVILTDNNTYDGVPTICINNGKVFIAWKCNDEDDIFGLNGKNTIMYREFDGSSWSNEKVLLDNCNNILSMDAIYDDDNKVYVTYSTDGDRSADTVDDKDIYYMTVSEGTVQNPVKVTNNKGINTNPQLINNNNKIGLFWFNDDTILYKEDINLSESQNIFNNKENIGTDRFKIIKNDDNLGLIWLKAVDDSIEVYGCLYDENIKEFTEPIQLTTVGQRTQSIDGIFNEKGQIVLASNICEKVEKEVNGYKYYDDGISSLVVTTINPSYNVRVNSESIKVNDSLFLLGEKIETTFNIENTGQLYIDKVRVDVYDKNPNDGGILNNSEIVDVNLKPGMSEQIYTNFTPMDAKQYDVYVKVSLIGNKESNELDNILNFNVGNQDVAIKDIYVSDVEDNRALRIEISNNSVIDSGEVNLIVRKNDKDGEILFTDQLDSIVNGDNKIVDYILDDSKINYDEGGQIKVYIELETKNKEKYSYNNSEYMIIDKILDDGGSNDGDKTPPVIYAKDIDLKVGDEFKVLEGVNAYDKEDGDITSSIVVIENTVNTSKAGIYKVVYEVRDSNGSTVTKEIKVTVNPKLTLINRVPKIEVEDTVIKIGSIFNPISIARSVDYEDGDITDNIEVIENTVNTSKAGVYKVVYKVADSHGAITSKTISVTVKEKEVIPPTGGGSIDPTPPIQGEIEFNDIKNHWAEKVIELFVNKGFINGYGDGTFKPNNSMTRAEFVKVVNKVFGYNQRSTEEFKDVNQDDWFYKDICIGIKAGYIQGRSKDIFEPNDNITREEAAMILTNIMKNKDENLDKLNTFKDADKTSKWAQSSMEGAIESGYINGYEDKTIRANSYITRAEAITMMSRLKK